MVILLLAGLGYNVTSVELGRSQVTISEYMLLSSISVSCTYKVSKTL